MEIGIGEFRKVARVMVVSIGEDVNKEAERKPIRRFGDEPGGDVVAAELMRTLWKS